MTILATPMTTNTNDETPSALAREPDHTPVLLAEVLAFVAPRAGGVYVDATFGGGGYTEALLDRVEDGKVVAIDRDRGALEAGLERLERRRAGSRSRLESVYGSFADLARHLDRLGFSEVDGIVADLGLSSLQLDDPSRGFSFSQDGPLDMRFDTSTGATAAELVNGLSETELADVLFELGEERRSRAIARRIVSRRPIETTRQLRAAVVAVTGPKRRGIDPATRTFQALRIAVNGELEALDALLEQGPERLAAGGRMVVVSFHSLEDRAVKHAFRDRARNERFRLLTKKPVSPSEREVELNPRARSAKLRALERAA